MLNKWHQAYTELTDYVAEHTDIKLKKDHVFIPENDRSDFYRLFNTTRAAFIKEKLPAFLNEAETLSSNYLRVEVRSKKSSA
jgi:hypothetical protein